MTKRVRIQKPRTKPRVQDDIIELRPGVWMFTPAWAKK